MLTVTEPMTEWESSAISDLIQNSALASTKMPSPGQRLQMTKTFSNILRQGKWIHSEEKKKTKQNTQSLRNLFQSVEMNENHPNENEQRLFIQNLQQQGVRHQRLYMQLVETQRQVRELENLVRKKWKGFRYCLMGGCWCPNT